MVLFELLGIAVVLYFVVSLILWILLDSNIELAFKERFGQPISSLRGQVVWVTGASSGIGKYLAIALAKNGVRVAISARRVSELNQVRDECLSASSGLLGINDVLVLPMDMLDLESHEKCLKAVVDHFGTLDILVNNAGRSQRANWEAISIEVDREIFELNLFSVINLSRKVFIYFQENRNGKGYIAVTSSVAALTTLPFSASYCATKKALHGYFESLKLEYPAMNVTQFCPGPVATNFLEEAFTDKPEEKCGRNAMLDPRRMTAKRCGELFAIALANKLPVVWAGVGPINALLYVTQFYPNISRVVLRALGAEGLKKIREGHYFR